MYLDQKQHNSCHIDLVENNAYISDMVTKEEKRKVVWYSGSASLSQAVHGGIEFAHISREDHQVGPWVFCKDYLQDAIWGTVNKKVASIYGYYFDPKQEQKPTVLRARLLITNSGDTTMRDKVPLCEDFVHQVEDTLGIVMKTTFQECENPPGKYKRSGVWLVEGSRRWVTSPVMLSMYTLLLRTGFVHTLGTPFMETIDAIVKGKIPPYSSVDRSRLTGAVEGIRRILKEGDRNIFHTSAKENYPSKADVGTVHNSMGIMGFTSGVTKSVVPHWHRKT